MGSITCESDRYAAESTENQAIALFKALDSKGYGFDLIQGLRSTAVLSLGAILVSLDHPPTKTMSQDICDSSETAMREREYTFLSLLVLSTPDR